MATPAYIFRITAPTEVRHTINTTEILRTTAFMSHLTILIMGMFRRFAQMVNFHFPNIVVGHARTTAG